MVILFDIHWILDFKYILLLLDITIELSIYREKMHLLIDHITISIMNPVYVCMSVLPDTVRIF